MIACARDPKHLSLYLHTRPIRVRIYTKRSAEQSPIRAFKIKKLTRGSYIRVKHRPDQTRRSQNDMSTPSIITCQEKISKKGSMRNGTLKNLDQVKRRSPCIRTQSFPTQLDNFKRQTSHLQKDLPKSKRNAPMENSRTWQSGWIFCCRIDQGGM